ncbi:hypothetical protein [Coxiella burnetii]|uniref:Uncharacterized protein n=2 Tax=Coxiella burnetii TaxID=777 RepID=B5QSD9_COXBU|nr:hypothetical protein [Coxiella burnetii]YP_002333012.1 hypothetical protein CBU_1559a [Coxiella burnetii RSA 493]ACI15303.1 hypothetical protein CBU_1559a [Coxiella burnetii RSA 493]ACI23099.1 hypothetical protein CBUD_0425b [Coxiella burnetii Dugway 5J108-111]ACJ17877.1 hypothetical protein CbuG_0451 [Coxiella burnetii CbuG_Q212]ACJ20916.1 hypothetical protein CbuK_1788 [Coxiella burnetii CbuK_Q154]AIT63996.1 hypothetical protein CBNA_1787 [Coxiella burnetii str. Namibia]
MTPIVMLLLGWVLITGLIFMFFGLYKRGPD